MVRVLVVLLAATSVARADPDATETLELAPGPYTGSIMAVDGFAITSFASGIVIANATADCECEELGSGYLMLFGLYGYAIGAPTVHWLREHRGRALASGALRITLPIVTGAIAHHAHPSTSSTVGWVFAGAVGAMMFDWAVLARRADDGARAPSISLFGAPVAGGAIAGATARW